MTTDTTGWKRLAFRGNKVWAEVDRQERPLVKNGKVRIKYQLDQDYEYQVKAEALQPLSQLATQSKKKAVTGKKPANKASPNSGPTSARKAQNDRAVIDEAKKAQGEEAIFVFTDGACTGNPGPAGIGVLLHYKANEKCISRYLGEATNNIAELKAIEAALKEIKTRDIPVRLFTDSSYAQGVLSQGWKAQKNRALIQSIKNTMAGFQDLQLIKVKGHAGVWENEKADELATSAIKKKKLS